MPKSYARYLRERFHVPNRIMAPVQWYGGKGNLVRWILKHLPPHKVYVEPYCGAASVFWHKPRAEVNVLNDLDTNLITLFRVLQDKEKFEGLAYRLTFTPYSLDEFRRARRLLEEECSEVDRAWAMFVAKNQGFSGISRDDGSWSRNIGKVCHGMAGCVARWRTKFCLLDWWHKRLQDVVLESREALEVVAEYDSKDTLFYLDPPYVHSTRQKGHTSEYTCEMTGDQHEKLVDVLLGLEGKVVLSGYDNEIYRPLEDAGWMRVEKQTACHAAGRVRGSKLQGKGSAMAAVPRTEVLWVKGSMQPRLF